jgi:ring-1,2-phenylacetyl-CoA epoxidase subunit PaaB
MPIWEIFGKRTDQDPFVLVGTIKAPDLDMALLLARETHFRHKEGVAYAVKRRHDDTFHAGPYQGQVLGGLSDRSYRRQEGYAGVGAKLKRIARDVARRGLVIDHPRPVMVRRMAQASAAGRDAGRERTGA